MSASSHSAAPVLVLGGTGEARDLADLLVSQRVSCVSSLAGAVAHPRLPQGELRVGGFGGAAGLAEFVTTRSVCAVVDATHPFAATISRHAMEAAAQTGTPLLRLTRPGWSGRPDARSWHWVDDNDAAGRAAARLGSRVLLTTGRKSLTSLRVHLADLPVVARVVDPPDLELPDRWRLVLDRGPYTLDGELRLIREWDVDVLVTKDSGGAYTAPKLDAAAATGVAVVIVRRPSPADDSVPHVGTPREALTWLRHSNVAGA